MTEFLKIADPKSCQSCELELAEVSLTIFCEVATSCFNILAREVSLTSHAPWLTGL